MRQKLLEIQACECLPLFKLKTVQLSGSKRVNLSCFDFRFASWRSDFTNRWKSHKTFFFFVIDHFDKLARPRVLGAIFIKAYPSETPFGYSTLGKGPDLTPKHSTRLNRLTRYKRSSLLQKVVTYGRCNIVPRTVFPTFPQTLELDVIACQCLMPRLFVKCHK